MTDEPTRLLRQFLRGGQGPALDPKLWCIAENLAEAYPVTTELREGVYSAVCDAFPDALGEDADETVALDFLATAITRRIYTLLENGDPVPPVEAFAAPVPLR